MPQDGRPSTPPCSALQKDNDYFLKDVFVVFQAENVLFRVPTHRFINESKIFAELFSVAEGADSEGSSECNPIRLQGVRSKDFKNFLKLLYPQTSTDRIWEKDEWISILRLATRWYFLSVRKIAIKKLEMFKFSPLENITLGREMKISKRLIEGYTGVVASSNTISDEDAAVIGWQTTLKLCRLREERTSRKLPSWVESVQMHSLSLNIRVALKEELSGILAEEMAYDTDFEYQSD